MEKTPKERITDEAESLRAKAASLRYIAGEMLAEAGRIENVANILRPRQHNE